MRLLSLEINSDFANLKGFRIAFDAASQFTVLVGRNGSGKSNLLVALATIFRDLDIKKEPEFEYSIQYECREKIIRVDAIKDENTERLRNRFFLGGNSVTASQFYEESNGRSNHLPGFVFGYYSGISTTLREVFQEHQRRYYDAMRRNDLLVKGGNEALRKLFFVESFHGQYVLLSFFVQNDTVAITFLKEHLGIEGVDSLLFLLHEPPWKSKSGDPRFWNAVGEPRVLLDRIYNIALAPMRLQRTVKLDFRRRSKQEHLCLFIKDEESIYKLRGLYDTERDFFRALESTEISELISSIQVRVKARNNSGSHAFRHLSEGEQQLLTVLGLLRFTKEEEALFLLDEPDTHLNPAWSMQYLDFIQHLVGNQETSHILMTSHNPLLFGGLDKEQVRLLHRASTGIIEATEPDRNPRGMGFGAILTSEVFGLRSQLDTKTLAELDRRRQLAANNDRTPDEERELINLNRRFLSLDFSETSARDPLYADFKEAMYAIEQTEHLTSPALSPGQKERRAEAALEALRMIQARENRRS